jgi:ribulose-phosphate 3-epimerase
VGKILVPTFLIFVSMANVLIAPSVLSADFGNLERDVKMINSSKADWFHVDIMDGVFVPNMSFGFPVMQAINKHATKPLDVHLMIVNPEKYIQTFKDCGAATISVHYEACTHLHRTIYQIKDLGCKAGIALNPHTPIHLLKDIIKDIDLVCMMSVNPGFGGQKFIEHTYQKVRELKQLIQENNATVLIEIDGGVNDVTGPKLVEAGADVLVAGNYVFSSKDPLATIEELKKI